MMNEKEYISRIQIGYRGEPGNMLSALSFEACRLWIYATDDETRKPVHDFTDPHIQELEAMLPRGYRRIPHN